MTPAVLDSARRSYSAPSVAAAAIPQISVLIPCYNAAATLAATWESLQEQSGAPWEAVCVDDASSDATEVMLEQFRRTDRRMQVLRIQHSGLAGARNAGLAAATGRHVLFLDADDVLRPGALASLTDIAAGAGSGCIIAAGYELLAESGAPLGIYRLPRAPQLDVDALLTGNPLPPFTLVPREAAQAAGFDALLPACEDWDFWLRLGGRGMRCLTLPRVLFGYRLRASSLTHQGERMFAAGRRVLESWRPRARDPLAHADVVHRVAVFAGALGQAAGDGRALARYWATLPPVPLQASLARAAADAVYAAYLRIHGARGQTWAAAGAAWRADVAAWLVRGPLARLAAEVLDELDQIPKEGGGIPAELRSFIARAAPGPGSPPAPGRSDRGSAPAGAASPRRTLVVYGLGTNGLAALEWLGGEGAVRSGGLEIRVADDGLAPEVLRATGHDVEDVRAWTRWPLHTRVLVTPAKAAAMVAWLARLGGRAGVDYLALNTKGAAV